MTDPIREALEQCLHAMDMQEGREREEFHINRDTAFCIWNAAKEAARRALAAPARDIQPEPFAWAYAYMDEFCEAFRFREDAEARMAKANEIRPAYRAKRDVRPLYTAPPCPAAAATRTNEVERDAARYRWIRDRESDWHALFMADEWEDVVPLATALYGKQLDAAIDAAMERGTPE